MKGMARTRLIEERKYRRWSQQQVADLIGTTRHNVSRWEAGLTTPGPYFRARLCEIFGKQIQELDLLLKNQPSPISASIEEDPTASIARFTDRSDLWVVPYPRNPLFTGRDTILLSLHKNLHQKHRMALTQSWAMSGLGGIGKTQIALEYAYRYRHDYAIVFWLNAATQETFLTDLRMIAECLQLPEKGEREQNLIIQVLKRWLAGNHEWLLIVDNVDDIPMIYDILPTEHSGHLLFTTRAQALGPLTQKVEVETMGIVEATLFLLRRSRLLAPEALLDQASPEQLDAAEAIAIEMGFLPLALDQAGAYIEEVGCSLSAYLEVYRVHQAELLKRRGHASGNYPEAVATTWSLNFQHIKQINPAAAELLRLCAFLDPDSIPEELIRGGSADLGPVLGPVAMNAFKLNEAIEELRTFSLVQRDPESRQLRLHRLVQVVLQDVLGPEDRSQWAERAVRATSRVFPHHTDQTPWPYDRRFLPQAQACSVLIQNYAFVFEEAATLLFRAANDLKEYGIYEQAEQLYQRAIHIQEQLPGPEHPDLAHSLTRLADLYRTRGKYEQAEAFYRQAVSLWENLADTGHPDLAQSLNGLAILYRDLGRYEQAEQFAQRAYRIQEQAFGPHHLSIVPSLTNLAIISQDLGKYEQAEQFGLQALSIWEQALGPEHPNVAYPLNNLGNLYQSQGKYEQAEPFFLRALQIWEQAIGPKQTKVAYPLYNLAELYSQQKKYEQAEPLYQRALYIWQQALGPEHPNVAYALHGLANLYRHLGRDQQSEQSYQRALSIFEQTLGQQHHDTQTIQSEFTMFQQERRTDASARGKSQ